MLTLRIPIFLIRSWISNGFQRENIPVFTKTSWLAWGSCPILLCYICTSLSFWWFPSTSVVTGKKVSDNTKVDFWGQMEHLVLRFVNDQRAPSTWHHEWLMSFFLPLFSFSAGQELYLLLFPRCSVCFDLYHSFKCLKVNNTKRKTLTHFTLLFSFYNTGTRKHSLHYEKNPW